MQAPSPKDHEVIDVGSGAPVLLEGGRARRALTLDGADAQGHYEETEDVDDVEDEQVEETVEHAYRRGIQAIPMESPGDDLRADRLMLDDDEDDAANHRRMPHLGVQRLRKLRGRRGFFHSDADARSFRYRSSGGILKRITLRRRKREDHDVFWTAIGVLTLLSFVLMCCITLFLTQTDFFASHQNDLFGTTVDDRFTVVAQDDAQIFLKSGYSNTVYSEGMITFADGELRIGRRAVESEESQTFYGVSLFANGSTSFTNRVESPMVEADYLTARKGVVFDDGTVMSTAASNSGTLDAKDVAVGGTAASILVGDAKTSGQVTKVASSVIQLDASQSVAINTLSRDASTTISGLVHFNGSSTTSSLLSVTDVAVRANPLRFRVGATGKTSIASIEAARVSIGGPGANATVLPPSDSTLELISSSITVGSEASEVSLTGKSVVVDATNTVTIGAGADEVAFGGEEVGKVSVQAEAVSMTGATTMSGGSLTVQSTKIGLGGKSTSEITIGAPEASVAVGSKAKIVSIGVDSPTVNIGSDASVINLSGSVTLNGKALGSRRLSAEQSEVWGEARSKRFGYLNAERVVVAVPQTEPTTTFALRWDAGYSSDPQAYQVEASKERMLSVASTPESNKVTGSYLEISLEISSVVLAVEVVATQPSKIRCRVFRHAADQLGGTGAVAMEVNGLVEHCSGTACEDGIFLGLHGRRLIPYSTGDSFSTQCTLASTATGELALQRVQYSFAEQ